MVWIIYAVVVLVVSGIIGMHLGRFREAYTEMLGMMVGMTMGMLNGFLLGYAAAAVTNSMFWGNLAGILLGLSLGIYFGRPGGLMGVMDGGMGGVMGGSMGAMLAVMVAFPRDAQAWTGILLGGIYVAGMVSLIVLIERSAPGHEALHRLAPFFTRAMATEANEAEEARYVASAQRTPRNEARAQTEAQAPARRLVDYYALLGVPHNASEDYISEDYHEQLDYLDSDDDASAERLEKALAVLTDPQRRWTYDQKLYESQAAAGIPLSGISANMATNQATVKVQQQSGPARQGQQPQIQSGPLATRGAGTATTAQGSRNGNGNGNGNDANRTNGQSKPGQGAGATKNSTNGQNSNNANRRTGSSTSNSKRAAQRQSARYARMETTTQVNLPVSWVGAVAFLVILLALGWFVVSSGVARTVGGTSGGASGSFLGAGGETQAQLDQIATVAQVGADGKQTVDVVLDSATFQYRPKAIKVKQGIPVHFNLSVENGDPG